MLYFVTVNAMCESKHDFGGGKKWRNSCIFIIKMLDLPTRDISQNHYMGHKGVTWGSQRCKSYLIGCNQQIIPNKDLE